MVIRNDYVRALEDAKTYTDTEVGDTIQKPAVEPNDNQLILYDKTNDSVKTVSVSTGDMLLINASGEVTVLNIGSEGDILEVNTGLPVWASHSYIDISGMAAGDILYYNSGWQLLNKGTDGDVLTLASGVPSWVTPSGGGGTYSGSVVYDANAPSSWTDLDLSSYVGANRALCFFMGYITNANGNYIVYGIRTNGDTHSFSLSDSHPRGVSMAYMGESSGSLSYLMAMTDENGIIEHKYAQVIGSGHHVYLTLVGYIVFS